MNQDEKSPLIADIPEPLVSKSPDRDSLIHQPAAPVVPFEDSLMYTGWIKLHRKIVNSALWTLENSHFKLALILLCNVNWQPKKWYDRIGKKEVIINPGQIVTSINSLVEMSKNLSPMQIRTGLTNLENINFLTQVVTKQYRLISIINWDTYQGSDYDDNIDDNKAITKQQQSGNKAVTITKEVKEFKEGKERKKNTTPFREFTDWFIQEYEARFNEKYMFTKKDGVLAAGMFKSLGLEELKRRTLIFFDSDDPWILNAGKTIPILHTKINSLADCSSGKPKISQKFQNSLNAIDRVADLIEQKQKEAQNGDVKF